MYQRLTQEDYYGMLTKRPADKIPLGFAVSVINGDLSSSGVVAPDKGYSAFGKTFNTTHKITKLKEYQRGSSGFRSMMAIRDDLTNSNLEYLNQGDTRFSSLGCWQILLANLTTGKHVGMTPFDDTSADNLLFCDGVNNLSRWSGAVAILNGDHAAAAATVTVQKITGDTKTNPTDGFAASGSFVIMSDAGARTVVTYSGKTTTTFTGCSGMPTAGDTAGVAELPDTSTYSGLPKCSVMVTHQARVWGIPDAEPTSLRFSKVADFTDWTAAANPDDPGARDFPEFGKNVILLPFDNWIIVGKEGGKIAYQIVYQSATTRSEAVKFLSDVGFAGPKAAVLIGDDYLCLSRDGHVTQLSRSDNENIFSDDNIISLIEPTLSPMVFDSDSFMAYWKKRDKVLVGGKRSEDSGSNDVMIDIQFAIGPDGMRRPNFGIYDWWMNDAAPYDKDILFGSSVQSEVFKGFDGFSKNGAPYQFRRTDRIETFGLPFETKDIPYYFAYGLISPGTTFTVKIYYEENGHLGVIEKSLSGNAGSPFITIQPLNTLGSFQLGTEPLGGTIEDIDELNFFRVFFPLPNEYRPYNIQRTIITDGVGQRLVVLRDGWVWVEAGDDINSEILKG
jgi:hypothetical protein